MFHAEDNMTESIPARFLLPPRGRRPWHVTHCDSTVTREIPSVLLESMTNKRYKVRRSNDDGKSDYGVVPGKSGNADGEKAVT